MHQRVFKPYNIFKGVVCTINHDGFKLKLKLDDWIQEKLFFMGEYEKAELKVLSQYLKPGGVFFDIGANLGLYSLYASRIVGETGKVISFEPFSINNNALKLHVEMNALSNVTIEKLAVGKEWGWITMYNDESEENLGMVTANFIENATKEEVEMVSIDDYLLTHPVTKVDFIKIDTEGFEYATLLGMLETLKKDQPDILIEILDDAEDLSNSDRVHELLKSLGYNKYYINDDGKISSLPTCSHRKNYLFAIS